VDLAMYELEEVIFAVSLSLQAHYCYYLNLYYCQQADIFSINRNFIFIACKLYKY